MTKRLVLHNTLGDIVRVLPWTSPSQLWAIFRKDTRRVELHSNLASLEQREIPFEVLQEVDSKQLEKNKVEIANMGFLQIQEMADIEPQIQDSDGPDDSTYRRMLIGALVIYVITALMITQPWAPVGEELAEKKEEKKREIVKVVKKKLVIPKRNTRQAVAINQRRVVPKKTATVKKGWKRRGALQALGQLSKSKQKGGLDLGAMKATAGPGLGGTQGSGGVQTSLYAKGLVAAPLGAGNNIKGGGGYGSKGRGGGKAGFGSVSLVGSTGASLIPIPREAFVEGGLSSDLIADVVRRNLGQVRFCYEKGLQMEPRLAGRVNVAWTIDANGQVKIARVKNTSLNSKVVEDCILQRLKTWKFPLPQNKAEVKVSYPFLLKRVGNS